MAHISDIKLIRTDTTLDLSQKAEKGMLVPFIGLCLYTQLPLVGLFHLADVGCRKAFLKHTCLHFLHSLNMGLQQYYAMKMIM